MFIVAAQLKGASAVYQTFQMPPHRTNRAATLHPSSLTHAQSSTLPQIQIPSAPSTYSNAIATRPSTPTDMTQGHPTSRALKRGYAFIWPSSPACSVDAITSRVAVNLTSALEEAEPSPAASMELSGTFTVVLILIS